MVKRSLVWCISFVCILVLSCGFEVLYRIIAHSRLRQIKEQIELAHPGSKLRDESYTRFGERADRLGVGLFEDAWEWARARWGRHRSQSSRLVSYDPGGYHRPFHHAYALVHLETVGPIRNVNHTFIWSPSKLRFVRWFAWNDCETRACPGLDR